MLSIPPARPRMVCSLVDLRGIQYPIPSVATVLAFEIFTEFSVSHECRSRNGGTRSTPIGRPIAGCTRMSCRDHIVDSPPTVLFREELSTLEFSCEPLVARRAGQVVPCRGHATSNH